MIGRRQKATITVAFSINGNPVRISPEQFTVSDGDELFVAVQAEIPIVQTPDTTAGVKILRIREVVDPEIER